MIHNAKDRSLFPILPLDRIHELCMHGTEVTFHDGETLFEEGQPDYDFFVVLEGNIRVTKKLDSGPSSLLTIHTPGEFTGDLSMLTGAPAIATGQAVGETRVQRYSHEAFRRMIAECPDLARPILSAMGSRAQEVTAAMVKQEKLAVLGKMSAGLAHELNNPAAAMVRSAQAMRNAVRRIASLGLQFDCRFTDEQRPIIEDLQIQMREEALDAETLSPLERSDREEALAEWLETNGIDNAWDLAPGLITAGMTLECVHELDGKLPAKALAAALTWFEADLTTNQLALELEASAERISDLVTAMKQFTYMDQAQLQEIDLHIGLESTLKVFKHKMRAGIEVRREYDKTIPKIAAYAGALNQVWTNLISNAIDAMGGKGVLTVRTRREGSNAVVEICDNGPGIPPDVKEQLFQPFFTTKPAGQGTGLGLEITRKIVVHKHGGTIEAESAPGDTRFIVKIPLERTQETQS